MMKVPCVGHEREIAHEELLLLDLAGLLDEQLDVARAAARSRSCPFAALELGVLGLAELVIEEAQLHPVPVKSWIGEISSNSSRRPLSVNQRERVELNLIRFGIGRTSGIRAYRLALRRGSYHTPRRDR